MAVGQTSTTHMADGKGKGKDRGELPPQLAVFLQEALAGPTLANIPADLQAQVTKGLRQKFASPPVEPACMALQRTLTQEEVRASPHAPCRLNRARCGPREGQLDSEPRGAHAQVRRMLFYPTAEDAAEYARLICGAPPGACTPACVLDPHPNPNP